MTYYKYYLYKEQVSLDNGVTWEDVTPAVTAPSGDPIASYSTLEECEGITSCTCADFTYSPTAFTVSSAATSVTFNYSGCTKPDLTSAATYNWIAVGNHTYNTGTTSGYVIVNVSANTSTSRTATLNLSLSGVSCQNLSISQQSGYIPPTPTIDGKYQLTLSDSSTVSAECDSTSAISQNEISAYSATVVSAEIGSCVASIGTQAFYGCSGLTSITIPSGVTTISWGAFSYCTALTSVTIPDSVTNIDMAAFSTCSGLTNVTIGTGVTTISSLAFGYCTSLTSITVNTTTPPTLGNSAFDNTNNCPIYVPCESVSAYQSASGWSTYASRIEGIPPCGQPTPTIQYRWTPSGWTCVGYDKYQNNIKEQSTDGGTTWTVVTPVEYSASTLIEANSPDCGYVPPTINGKYQLTLNDSSTITAACDSTSAITSSEVANQYSGTVVSATIGPCVNTLSEGAFETCYNLTSISIPGNVTTIDIYAFANCTGLTSVEIGNGVTSIGCGAFVFCESLTSVVIPNSVTIIESDEDESGAFLGCYNLTSVTIPNSITTIGRNTFEDCRSLTSIVIPNSVTSIGFQAFAYCYSLTSVTIGSGIVTIDDRVFDNCHSLTSVTCLATTPPTLGEDVFIMSLMGNSTIYVPCASVNAYKSASEWSSYADRIQAIP